MRRTLLERANDILLRGAGGREPEPEVDESRHERAGDFGVLLEPVLAEVVTVARPLASDAGLRWRATAAANLEALLRTSTPSEDSVPGPAAGAVRLVQWLGCSGPDVALQLRLRADPRTRTLRITVLAQIDGPSRDEALGTARRVLPELSRILEQDDGARVTPVEESSAVDDLRASDGWSVGRSALPLSWVRHATGLPTLRSVPVRAPQGSDALATVLSLLLRQSAPCAVLVSLRATAAEEVPSVYGVASLHSADVAARLNGRQTWDTDRLSAMTHFPHDLAELKRAEGLLATQLEWLADLAASPFACSVAVVGGAPPGSPLLVAVQGALVGAPRVEWRELTADQVQVLAQGPREALAAPVGEVTDDDGIVALGDDPRTLVTGLAAAHALEWPVTTQEDLPGLVVEARRPRPVPALLLDAPGVLLGHGRGPTGPVAVRLGRSELARHLYVCGRTGVGKSTLLRTMVGDLGRAGDGVCLIDPHGDLSDEVITDLEDRRDVVVFDPSRPDCPGLDPLVNDGSAADQERVIEDLTAIIFRIYPADYMGPMFDRHSRALLVPLLCAAEPLASMARLAVDDKFRARCLARLDKSNPIHSEVLTFWQDEYPNWSSSYRGEMQSYTVSKYEALVKSSLLRHVCTRGRAQLDIAGIIERGDVLIARLPAGQLGAVSSWFMGMLLLSRLQAAVFARCKVPVAERKPFTLVIDEFQCFVGQGGFGYNHRSERTLGPLLSEARKYGLRLVLANQFAAQLDDSTRQALFGNVGSLVSFRVGWDDAVELAKNLGGGATPEELRDLPVYRAMARLSAGGSPAPLTSLTTIPPDGLTRWLRGAER